MKRLWRNLKHYPWTFPELRKIVKNFNLDNQPPGQNSNRASHEYKRETLNFEQTSLDIELFIHSSFTIWNLPWHKLMYYLQFA